MCLWLAIPIQNLVLAALYYETSSILYNTTCADYGSFMLPSMQHIKEAINNVA
jgi:hypothetical protein